MRYRRASPLFFLLLCWGLTSAPAAADEHKQIDLGALHAAAEAIAEVPGINDVLRSCPAELQGTRTSWRIRIFGASDFWTLNRCQKHLPECAENCIERSDGKACYHLARLIEKHERDTYDKARREAYALACALGHASGCTNRGASLRNAPREFDTLDLADGQNLDKCLAASFSGACTAQDAWGCAMSGQALRLGEGVPQSAIKARAQLQRACVLSGAEDGKDTAAAPCRFARRQLKLISDDAKDSP